jgi:hypothetical protein
MAKIQAKFRGTSKNQILDLNKAHISLDILNPTARILLNIIRANNIVQIPSVNCIMYRGKTWGTDILGGPPATLSPHLHTEMDIYIQKKQIADAGLDAAISYLKVAYSFSSCLGDIYFLIDDFIKELVLPNTFRKTVNNQIKKGKTELTEKDKAIFDDEAKHYLKEIEIYKLNMHLFGD